MIRRPPRSTLFPYPTLSRPRCSGRGATTPADHREALAWRARADALLVEFRLSRAKCYGVDFSGHTSTTPCATAQAVLETRLTASSRVEASMTADPGTGRPERRNGSG